jgi:predicted transposase YbfD/YdcC
LGWLRQMHALAGGGHFAIDGKTLRRSGSPASGLGPLHLVSVWATQANLSLGQVAVDEKSNEITAIPKLLELLDLHGALVTIDAMGCQKKVARQVTEGGGDYVLTVKENQPHLLEDVVSCFVRAIESDFQGVGHDQKFNGGRNRFKVNVLRQLRCDTHGIDTLARRVGPAPFEAEQVGCRGAVALVGQESSHAVGPPLRAFRLRHPADRHDACLAGKHPPASAPG